MTLGDDRVARTGEWGRVGHMNQPTNATTTPDPDADPENLNPRDLRQEEPYTGDPDADPGNLNPRDTLPDSEPTK
jgi:hypothetical protein